MAPPGEDPSPRIRDRLAGEVVALGLRGPLVEKLPHLLRDGEEVEFVALCAPGEARHNVRNELRDPRLLVLTDSRILLLSTKLLLASSIVEEAASLPTREIAYREVREVADRPRLTGAKLKLDVAGEEIWLTGMRRKTVRTAAEIIRRNAAEAAAWWR